MKRVTSIRTYAEEKDKINQISRELSALQKCKVTCPEVIRRMTNIPNVYQILKEDAYFKRNKR